MTVMAGLLAILLADTGPPRLAAAAACTLPAGLRTSVAAASPGWVVTTLSHLSEGDRSLYLHDHRGGCPGLVQLDLYGDPQPSIALSLVRGSKYRLLVARQRRLGVWSVETLESPDDEGMIPVVL